MGDAREDGLIEPDVLDVMDAVTGDHGMTVRLLDAMAEASYAVVDVRASALERAQFVLQGMFGPMFPASAIMMALAEEGVYVSARPELRHDLVSQTDGTLLATHPPDRCKGRHCVIHNPSDHPLKDAPIHWHGSLRRTERVCSHDQHHPDPDHLSYVFETLGLLDWMAHKAHPCDGCCKIPGASKADTSTADTEGNPG